MNAESFKNKTTSHGRFDFSKIENAYTYVKLISYLKNAD